MTRTEENVAASLSIGARVRFKHGDDRVREGTIMNFSPDTICGCPLYLISIDGGWRIAIAPENVAFIP